MTKLQVINQGNEKHFSVREDQGISVADLKRILNALPPEADNATVCLCVHDVESYETRIVKASNEGDNNIFWLHVDRKLSMRIENSFN